MKRTWLGPLVASAVVAASTLPARAQSFTTDDPVLRAIWSEGRERSRVVPLAQTLLDSIGPRLTGSPGMASAQEWAVARYAEWGIPARNERYGTWRSWRRGVTHVDLLAPRVRTLSGTMLAWSPGTPGPVTGGVAVLPDTGFARWLPGVRGKYVMLSFAEPTCRPEPSWRQFATPESLERMRREREAEHAAWRRRLRAAGGSALPARLEAAGAAGIVLSEWAEGWGSERIFDAVSAGVPTIGISCEDYGLLHRLAGAEQGPMIRVNAEAELLGERPVFNTIAEIRGSELPNEYVVLSAHLDTWDGASGATDNGTGTVAVMEAMRILRAVYPRPRRTILAGHWSGEEQGLNGSRAFVRDRPEVVRGMQALFNQDSGTGRVVHVSMQGFTGAGDFFRRWLARVPPEIAGRIELTIPGAPGRGGSDYASFVCAGAPAFGLSSLGWDYETYTWHTDLDTYDKIVREDLRDNAVLTAMLAYLASEDPRRVPRDRRSGDWPACRPAARSTP